MVVCYSNMYCGGDHGFVSEGGYFGYRSDIKSWIGSGHDWLGKSITQTIQKSFSLSVSIHPTKEHKGLIR